MQSKRDLMQLQRENDQLLSKVHDMESEIEELKFYNQEISSKVRESSKIRE